MLIVDRLTFGFFHKPLFQNISFAVDEGELVHLSGSNGTGKTTLINILAGLLSQNSGEITYKEPENFTYLASENNGHYLKLDAVENLQYWLALRGINKSKTELFAELELWGLNHPLIREHFAVEKFSTGMKRRLALARVKLSQTKLWLIDEPLLGLDKNGIETLHAMVDQHLKSRGSIVMISHDMQKFEHLKSRAINLD